MELIERCDQTLAELYKFSKSILFLGDNILDSRIEDLEKDIGFKLPLDFKYIIKKHNGITLAVTEVYGLSEEFRGNSLDKIYTFEHAEVENVMPRHFFPFSPDGQGNHYCFDLSELVNDQCPVIFWQWDMEYKSLEEVEVCNSDFVEWLMK